MGASSFKLAVHVHGASAPELRESGIWRSRPRLEVLLGPVPEGDRVGRLCRRCQLVLGELCRSLRRGERGGGGMPLALRRHARLRREACRRPELPSTRFSLFLPPSILACLQTL